MEQTFVTIPIHFVLYYLRGKVQLVPPTSRSIIPRFYQISMINIQHSDMTVPRESISGSS
jgi:hypothetical protein